MQKAEYGRHCVPLLPVVFDAAMLLMMATSDTEIAQPMQDVWPDCAVELCPYHVALIILDHAYEPIKTLAVPPYAWKKTCIRGVTVGVASVLPL